MCGKKKMNSSGSIIYIHILKKSIDFHKDSNPGIANKPIPTI